MSKKILITGGKGMVGQYFEDYPFCYITHKDELDVTDTESVLKFVENFQPSAIIHLAAETNVDLCEKNPELTFRINAEGAKNVAIAAKKENCLIVDLSTAGVFSGEGESPFKTTDTPKPINVYAKSKLQGEQYVVENASKYLIVRTGWIFGGFERDKKFVSLIANQIWNGSKVIEAIDSTFGCPTYGKDLAATILKLIDEDTTGIAHVVNKGYASRYQIAKEIVNILNAPAGVHLADPTSFPTFDAPRPKFEVIEPTVDLRPWQEALKEYLTEWAKLRENISDPDVSRS